MEDNIKPYNTLSGHLKSRFGCKVFKVTVNAGLTCPNRDGKKGYGGCVYCDSSTLVPKDYNGDVDIKSQLALGIEKVRKRHNAQKFIAYFQINTNTYAPYEQLEKVYREALHFPEVAGIAVSTRPDCVDDRVMGLLSALKKEKCLWLELGLQSSNDVTLNLINRGHSAEDFAKAVFLARKHGIDTCAHVIIGLPGEGREEILKTIEFISGLSLWGVKFHQLQVLKGTEMEAMYNRGEVKVLELEDYARLVIECLERLAPSTVIHRLCGDAPMKRLVAPRWGANKFMVIDKVAGLMLKGRTCQGRRWVG